MKVKKYGVKNHFTNLSSLLTYDSTGEVDYTDKFDAFDDAYSFAEEDAGTGILTNSQDRDFRSAFNLGRWKPKGDPQAMAIEVRAHSVLTFISICASGSFSVVYGCTRKARWDGVTFSRSYSL